VAWEGVCVCGPRLVALNSTTTPPVVNEQIMQVGQALDVLLTTKHSGFPVVHTDDVLRSLPRMGSLVACGAQHPCCRGKSWRPRTLGTPTHTTLCCLRLTGGCTGKVSCAANA
jgi:hypothetical protein